MQQRIMGGDGRFVASQELPDLPDAAFAERIGLRGIRVDKPVRLGDAWEQTLSFDRLVVLEAISDPDPPTLPPQITVEQARLSSHGLLKVDPNEAGMIKQSIKGMVAGFIHAG